MSGRGRNPVKVKVIMTEFVRTDAQSFKSVVQRLTGRDTVSTAAAAPTTRPLLLEESSGNGGMKAMIKKELSSTGEGYHQLQEMDMFLELPTFDEFIGFYCD